MNSWDFMIETEEESFEIEKVLAVNITVNCVTPTQHTHTQKWIKEQHTTLKKLGSAGIFLQWPVCRSKTIACSLHLFFTIPPSILQSVWGKEGETLGFFVNRYLCKPRVTCT